MVLLLAACARDADLKTPEDTDADTDADSDTDTDTDADSDTDTDTDVLAPATDGVLTLPFSVDASGGGPDRLDDVALLDASGTLVLSGVSHLAVAYQDHDWSASGYHLYDLISLAEDGSNLAVTYLYCQDGALPYAYTESFLHPMGWESTTGTCAGSAQEGQVNVSLPALRAAPAPFDPGVRIEGDDVSYDGEAGRIVLAGVERDLRPFNVVDCTDCPGGPWYEVHSLLDGPADACFAILYLYPDDPSFVQVEYGICLPTLERLSTSIDAGWTGGLDGPPPPPRLLRPVPSRLRPEAR
ncbi:MAG: hypothetical protein V4850_10935 [Myxococcota bacterium]